MNSTRILNYSPHPHLLPVINKTYAQRIANCAKLTGRKF